MTAAPPGARYERLRKAALEAQRFLDNNPPELDDEQFAAQLALHQFALFAPAAAAIVAANEQRTRDLLRGMARRASLMRRNYVQASDIADSIADAAYSSEASSEALGDRSIGWLDLSLAERYRLDGAVLDLTGALDELDDDDTDHQAEATSIVVRLHRAGYAVVPR
jgi:hypothetical protein